MPSLSLDLVDLLGDLVVDIRESFEEEGYTIAEALDKNRSFRRTGRPQSELTRSIMSDAFERGSMRLGLNYRDGKSGAVELYERVESGQAIIRLKRAKYVRDELRVSANAATTLNGISDDLFAPEYHYVLGWVLENGSELGFFVAEIIGVVEGRPGYYQFGWIHEFRMPTHVSNTGFQPASDEDLGDWEQGLDDIDLQG